MKHVGNFCVLWLLGVSVSNSLSISEEVQQRSQFPSYGSLDSPYDKEYYTNSHHRNKREQHAREYPSEYVVFNGPSGRNSMPTDDPFKSTHHHRRPANWETDSELDDFPRQKHSYGMKDLDNLPYEGRQHSHHRHGENHRFREYASEYSARPHGRTRLDQTFDETDGVYRNLMYNEYPYPLFNQHRRSEDRELGGFPHRPSSHTMRHRRHFQPFYEQSEMYNNDYQEDLLRYREEKYCQRHPAACSRARGRRDSFGYLGKTDKRNLMYNQQSPELPIDRIDPIQMQEFTAALASLTFSDLPKNPKPNHTAKVNKSSPSVDDHSQDTKGQQSLSAKDPKAKISTSPKDNSELNEESKRPPTHTLQSKEAQVQSAELTNDHNKETEDDNQSKPEEASTVKGDHGEQSNSDQPKPDNASKVEDKAEQPNTTSSPEIQNDLKHSVESKDQSETIPDSSENKVSSSLDDDEKVKNEQKSIPSPTGSKEKIEDTSTKVEDQAKSAETSTSLNKTEEKEQPADPKSLDKEPNVRSKFTSASGSPKDHTKSNDRKTRHELFKFLRRTK